VLWIILVAFGIPLLALIFQLFDERKDHRRRLERIRKRLRELEESDDDA